MRSGGADAYASAKRAPVAGELVAQALGQRARRIEAHDVAQVAMHVLEVLGPRTLPRRAPRDAAVDLIHQAMRRGFRLGRRGRVRELLDVLQQRQQRARVSEQDGVQLVQRGARRFEEDLAAIERAEPVGLEQAPDLALEVLLLEIEAALPALDAGDELGDRDLERAGDGVAPLRRRSWRVRAVASTSASAVRRLVMRRDRLARVSTSSSR